jgi:hypothetical protein
LAALLAAGLSIGLALGTGKRSEDRVAANSGVRSHPETAANSFAKEYKRVEGPVRTLAPAGDPAGNDIGTSSALCPSGKRVISGGYQTITGGGEIFYNDALTRGHVGWAVGATNKLARSGMVQAVAYCAGSVHAVAAGNRQTLRRQRAAAIRELQALVSRYKAIRVSQRSAVGGL